MRDNILLVFFLIILGNSHSQPQSIIKQESSSSPKFSLNKIELPDTAEILNKLNVEIMFGRQFLSSKWSPYTKTKILLGASAQIRLTKLYWFDGSFIVAFAGETDAYGNAAGPGSSLVEMHNGLIFKWDFTNIPISFYAGGGLTYVWARLEIPDESKVPLPISEFLNKTVFPETKNDDGHFWGGYIRGSIIFHLNKEWYLGLGAFGILTTSRKLLGRSLNINSTLFEIMVGIEG